MAANRVRNRVKGVEEQQTSNGCQVPVDMGGGGDEDDFVVFDGVEGLLQESGERQTLVRHRHRDGDGIYLGT